MNMPGFTAEASFYTARQSYGSSVLFREAGTGIYPAQGTCVRRCLLNALCRCSGISGEAYNWCMNALTACYLNCGFIPIIVDF
jgi:hypothetical protein